MTSVCYCPAAVVGLFVVTCIQDVFCPEKGQMLTEIIEHFVMGEPLDIRFPAEPLIES